MGDKRANEVQFNHEGREGDSVERVHLFLGIGVTLAIFQIPGNMLGS